MKLETLIDNIESLPPLNDAILKIQKLYTHHKEEMNITQLVDLIESDALLAANILKIANSPVYGFSRKIASVAQAVTLFGIMQIYALVINHAINQNLEANTEVYGVSKERFNAVCHIQSALIMKWYAKINLEDAKLLSSIALVMEAGKLILADEVTSSSYEEEFKAGLQRCRDIGEYERGLINTTSYSLSALLFDHWHLEPQYTQVLNALDSDEEMTQKVESYVQILNVVKTAVNMKELLTKNSVLKACELLKDLDLKIEPFVTVVIGIKKSYIKSIQEAKDN